MQRSPAGRLIALAWLLLPRSGLAADRACAALLRADSCGEPAAHCLFDEARSGHGDGALRALARENPSCPWPVSYLGDLAWDDAQQAAKRYRQAAVLFAALGDAAGEVQVRTNLYELFAETEVGRRTAERELRAASQVAARTTDRIAKIRVEVFTAKDLWRKAERLGQAYDLLKEAERAISLGAPERLERECLLDLANVSLEIGQREEAKSHFARLDELALHAKDRLRVALAKYGLAQVIVEGLAEQPALGSPDQAQIAARAALAAAETARHGNVQLKSHWILGMLTTGRESEGHFDRCFALAVKPREKSYCMSGLARRLATLAPAGAERATDEAVALAETAKDPWQQAFAVSSRMHVAWATGPIARATLESWNAIRQIEALRANQKGSRSSSGLFSTWSDDYDWFAGHLLETGRPDLLTQAFDVMEHLRGRALLDSLGKAQALAGRRPEEAGFASLREVQAQLAEDEALLSYQIAPWKDWTGDFGGGSWLLAVTRRGTRAVPLRAMGRETARRTVDQLVTLFERHLRQSDREAALAGALYRDLLAPGLAGLPPGVRKLIVLPDDALHRLPFALLRAAPGAEPLAARFEVVTAPSATLWRRWRRESSPRGARAAALVLANPVRLGGLPALPPLPEAEIEGRGIVAALGAGSSLRTGEAASESFVKGRKALAGFAVFHLATHTVVDERDPSGSAVRLTPGRGEDGFLRESEIVALPLGGKLVVLSSCSSARGETLRGEGVLSLARAFFAGGAHAVVASLWPLRDDEAEALFARFYHHLGSGLPVGAALRAAQRDRIGDGARPEAWAGLVAIGDGDLRPVPRARPRTRAGR